jgi:hypothetical protein
MKPAKSFVVEIKRNGRRQVVREQEPLWDPKQLKSATDAIGETQKASEIDPKPQKGNRRCHPKTPHLFHSMGQVLVRAGFLAACSYRANTYQSALN